MKHPADTKQCTYDKKWKRFGKRQTNQNASRNHCQPQQALFGCKFHTIAPFRGVPGKSKRAPVCSSKSKLWINSTAPLSLILYRRVPKNKKSTDLCAQDGPRKAQDGAGTSADALFAHIRYTYGFVPNKGPSKPPKAQKAVVLSAYMKSTRHSTRPSFCIYSLSTINSSIVLGPYRFLVYLFLLADFSPLLIYYTILDPLQGKKEKFFNRSATHDKYKIAAYR